MSQLFALLFFALQIGPFVPQDPFIQGSERVTYDANGSPETLNASGFGNGFDLNLSAGYFFSDMGLMFDAGIRMLQDRKIEMALAPNGFKKSYENKLVIVPLTFSLVYKLSLNSKLLPYMGVGLGFYISQMEFKSSNEDPTYTRTIEKGDSLAFGPHFLMGLFYPIYHDIHFNTEFRYNYSPSDWKLKNSDSGTETEYKALNTGGISIKFGLAFKI